MGGVCSVVEGIISAGMVGQGIAEIVLKAQLKALVDSHAEEFKLMNELYEFIDSILSQKNLVSQLNTGNLFAANNWNTIFNDLEDKNDLFKTLVDQFSDIKPANFNYTANNGLMFSVYVLALGYVSYNFIGGNSKASITSNISAFKKFCKATANRIRGAAPEIRGSRVRPDGSIETTSHGSNAGEVPPEIRRSSV